MQEQLCVEPVDNLVVARVQGVLTESLLRECQKRILDLLQETKGRSVLYDGLKMEPPSIDVVLMQPELDAQLGSQCIRRAIVVPNTRIAFLSRLAFGDGDYRVFYNDFAEAVNWLNQKLVRMQG